MSISKEIMIDRKEILDGKVLHVTVDTVRIEDEELHGETKTATREAVWHRGASAILPVDADGKILLVRQYRYAAAMDMLEIPAGKIDFVGESPDVCAARELEEETGCTGDIKPLGYVFTSPGFCDERIYLYFADNLKKGQQHLDDDEYLNIERYTPQEMKELIDNNTIIDAKTIACFEKARKYLNI